MRGPRRGRRASAALAFGGRPTGDPVNTWEYLIVALPPFHAATPTQGQSDSVVVLNHEGADGWEAVGMTSLADGKVAVLMKRDTSQRSTE